MKERSHGPSQRILPRMIQPTSSDLQSIKSAPVPSRSAFKRVTRRRWNHHTTQTKPAASKVPKEQEQRDDTVLLSTPDKEQSMIGRPPIRAMNEMTGSQKVRPREIGTNCWACAPSRNDSPPIKFMTPSLEGTHWMQDGNTRTQHQSTMASAIEPSYEKKTSVMVRPPSSKPPERTNASQQQKRRPDTPREHQHAMPNQSMDMVGNSAMSTKSISSSSSVISVTPREKPPRVPTPSCATTRSSGQLLPHRPSLEPNQAKSPRIPSSSSMIPHSSSQPHRTQPSKSHKSSFSATSAPARTSQPRLPSKNPVLHHSPSPSRQQPQTSLPKPPSSHSPIQPREQSLDKSNCDSFSSTTTLRRLESPVATPPEQRTTTPRRLDSPVATPPEQSASYETQEMVRRRHTPETIEVNKQTSRGFSPVTLDFVENSIITSKKHVPSSNESSSNESLTVLSVFSLVTPPTQWIQKDSFLHRRKKLDQWGIPVSNEMKRTTLQRMQAKAKSPIELEKLLLETTLTERLVWVKYKNKYWWPAILYDNYRHLIHDESLQEHVWYRLPLFWQRLNLASLLVFHKDNPRNHKQVARLLGRGTTNENGMGGNVEVVEVEETWPLKDEAKISQVIDEMALNGDYFRDHPTLYLDWHRAMDQVELLLCECLGVNRETLEDEQLRQDINDNSLMQQSSDMDDERRRNKQAKAVTAALLSATHDKGNMIEDSVNNDENRLDDNSLIATTVESSQLYASKFPEKQHQNKPTATVPKRRKSWVERAKDAEYQQWVAKCHDCSTTAMDALENVCLWKDNLVASMMMQPTLQKKKEKVMMKTEKTPREVGSTETPNDTPTTGPGAVFTSSEQRQQQQQQQQQQPHACGFSWCWGSSQPDSLYHAARPKERQFVDRGLIIQTLDDSTGEPDWY